MTQAPDIHLNGTYKIADKVLFNLMDFTVPAGQWSCLLGRSGVGKSTVLRLIADLDCAGRFDGQITSSDRRDMSRHVSFMAQSDLLLPWLTALENTVIGARVRGEHPDMKQAQILLRRVGLGDHMHHKPSALSGGMRQRVALARTLLEDRAIALLDEPFSALDASTRAEMQELAAECLAGKTVVLVTHDPAEAVRLGHQIAVLTRDGMRSWPVPTSHPVRDQYAKDTIQCQMELLAHLRACT